MKTLSMLAGVALGVALAGASEAVYIESAFENASPVWYETAADGLHTTPRPALRDAVPRGIGMLPLLGRIPYP